MYVHDPEKANLLGYKVNQQLPRVAEVWGGGDKGDRANGGKVSFGGDGDILNQSTIL